MPGEPDDFSELEQPEGSRNAIWLAYELHDGLLQWILSARMTLESVAEDDSSVSSKHHQAIQSTKRMLEAASEEGRQLIQFLERQGDSETIDMELGVNAFVSMHHFELQANQQSVHVEPDQAWPILSPKDSWNLLRIVQQGIQNAMQHAGPCQVTISVQVDESTWEIRISDNGRGFDSEKEPIRGHFGLPGMRHRAELMKASIQIEASVGKGTVITVQGSLRPDRSPRG